MQSAPDSAETSLLEVLRTFDNPFDTFVEARRRDGGFARRHVPEVNGDAWTCIDSALERFRAIARGEHPQDELPRAGILVVTGPRGAGKTHLLHALEDSARATIVAPSHYDVVRSFGEYVLHELVLALQHESPTGDSALSDLSEAYTKAALMVALRQTDELSWLAHNASHRIGFWRFRMGAPDAESLTTASELRQRLRTGGRTRVADLVTTCGVDLRAVRSLLERHVQSTERGATVEAHVRRTLMQHLFRAALDQEGENLTTYLVDGFAEMPSGLQPHRDDLVDALLMALSQLLFVQERPVVVVFDALEALLGDPPDEERCRAFFGDLANHLDAFRGLMCVVLAEEDYFTDVRRRYATQYAQQRVEQGVPTLGYGSLWHVPLDPPSSSQLRAIVEQRMASLWARVDLKSDSPPAPLFPFQASDLEGVMRREGALSLRRALQILRDRYQELVFGTPQPVEPALPEAAPETQGDAPPEAEDPPPPKREEQLVEAWERSLRSAQRVLGAGVVTAHADRIHKGLEAWLKLRATTPASDQPKLVSAKHAVFGTHPTYGQCVRCTWGTSDGPVEQAIGVLLGRGTGMPRDLAEKVTGLERGDLAVEGLCLLWPTAKTTGEEAALALPPATHAVWSEQAREESRQRIRLVPISPNALALCLGFLEWRQRWHEIEGGVEPAEALQVIEGRMRPLWNAVLWKEDSRVPVLQG